ncbi:MAG: propanediol utilization protein [Pseudomonadota bacterium]
MDQPRADAVKPKAAEARVACHLGELVQGRLGPSGPVALVTLPCPALSVRAHFVPSERDGLHTEDPLARRVAEAAAHHLDQPHLSGNLTVAAEAPMGGGAGVSTATGLATLRAIARSIGATLTAEEESALLLSIEGATDPLAFPATPPRLWAPREARTLEILPPLPAMTIVGGFDGPGQRTDPADTAFPDATELFAALRHGRDPAAIAKAATASAVANQARNPKPHWAELNAIAAAEGALGIAVAHTGSAVALLFPPGHPPPLEPLQRLGLRQIVAWTLEDAAPGVEPIRPGR